MNVLPHPRREPSKGSALLQPITITLDDREVSGYPGMTVLELARESGISIPTLCHHAQLTPGGACRVCLVEDKQSGRLMASCVTPIAPGMVISTHSPRVIEHRKTIVKLMLASHPDSCLVCDKGNRCELRQIASEMGIASAGFQRIMSPATIDELNPFIARDPSKCIVCGKCIRVCQELVVVGAIDYFRRGFVVKAATINDAPLEESECTFCGTCVAVCPTGALAERVKAYTGTTRYSVETTCPFCGCGCSLRLELKGNRIVRVSPGNHTEANRGALCIRGSYGWDFVHSPDRLTKPLVKVNTNLEEAPWEQALDSVASQFNRIKREHGPGSLAVLGSSKCTNEENYLLQRFARCVLGTNNIDSGSRLYNAATRIGLGTTIGFPGTTHYLSSLEQSEVIVVIGADPPSSAPIVGYAIKRAVKNKGAKLIVIDPRRTRLAEVAYLWLRPKVGTDVALLNSLARVIVDEQLLDDEFVTRKATNFEAFADALREYSPEHAEAITGIPSQEIRAAARLYAKADRAALVYGSGLTQHEHGTDGVRAVANLAILTGQVGRGGIHALQRENNGQGACDMGVLPDFLPGYQNILDAGARKTYEDRWATKLPPGPGLTAAEFISQAKEGKVKGLYVVGENPVLSFPNRSLIMETLASLDFLVVQDLFLTDTAKLASVVLPAASFAEKEGTFTNVEGRVNRVRKAVASPGDSLADWEIILRLADKMGCPLPFSSLQQVTCEIEALVPLYEGYSDAETLREAELGGWEMRRTYGGQFLKGFARFSPVNYKPTSDLKEGYPFTLLTGTEPNHFGTGTRSSRSSRLKDSSPACLEIGGVDCRTLALRDGDRIAIVSPYGKMTTTVKITDTLPEKVLFMPNSRPGNPVNQLFSTTLDQEAKTPLVKACRVRLEKVTPDE
ncbi:MAG: molybdopterin-dependent oxidoreductase [Chloroflexi bacterium]|nr:molybdopterin-dependent oxidoreductase [Chloroflexota bacterium]